MLLRFKHHHLDPAFSSIRAFNVKHIHPLTSTSPVFKINFIAKRLLKAIFFGKRLIKFIGTAFKQKAALSFDTGVAVGFMTNNILSSRLERPSLRGKIKKNSKLLSYLIWVLHKARATATCFLKANHWTGKDGQPRSSPRAEKKAKNRWN